MGNETPIPTLVVAGVTGHRPDKLGGWDPLHPVVQRVKASLRDALIRRWPSRLITGMANGVDQWAAEAALDLGIPFGAVLPCDADAMAALWPLPSKERFAGLLTKAAAVEVVAPGPFKPWKLQRRNEWIVDHCQVLLAVHDGSVGGTFNCLCYAETVQRDVERLAW